MGVLGFAKQLLIPGFLGYVGYEVYNIYLFCQPPLAIDGVPVTWDLQQSPPLDFRIFLATTEQPPSLQPKATVHVVVAEFLGVEPSASASAPDIQVPSEAFRALPDRFYRNKTIYLHAVAATSGDAAVIVRSEVVRISRFVLHQERVEGRRFLLSSVNNSLEGDGKPTPAKPLSSLPRVVEVGFVQELRPLDHEGLVDKGLGQYIQDSSLRLPLYVNTLVSPRDEYVPILAPEINGTGQSALALELRLRNIGLGYWTLQLQMGQGFDDAERLYGMSEYDIDSFKQMIGGSSPWKILLVYSIAILHLVFEFLAFSADLEFWREKTSFEGLSSSSLGLQCCSNVIMLLYVMEQQKTKFVIYLIAFRLLFQLWKLKKLTTFQRQESWPFVRWVDRSRGDLAEGEEVDDSERRCMRWLLLLLLPLVVTFSVYRLLTQEFRSWYSWIVLSLAMCSQTGGFVVMTPQVQHLPWRALTYQAINTFIDDVFMLCIRMPEVQKFSVFRDDIVFIICLVQRYVYRKRAIEPEDKGVADGAVKDKDE